MPALLFLDSVPTKVRAEINAVLDAVAEAPPPAFSGGGKWEVMHGDMAGFYEVRVKGGGMNHRLFCILERDAEDLGGSSIVAIDGLSKPRRSAVSPRDYQRVSEAPARVREAPDPPRVAVPASLQGATTRSRSMAMANEARVLAVGLGASTLNSRRTTSGARSA